MPKTKAEKNVEYLKSIRRNSSDVNNHRINEIIDLYSQRKIPNLKTPKPQNHKPIICDLNI
jgi:hypothetical protein